MPTRAVIVVANVALAAAALVLVTDHVAEPPRRSPIPSNRVRVTPAPAVPVAAAPVIAPSRHAEWRHPGAHQLLWRWTWPEVDDFQDAWRSWDDGTTTRRVIRGHVTRAGVSTDVEAWLVLGLVSGGKGEPEIMVQAPTLSANDQDVVRALQQAGGLRARGAGLDAIVIDQPLVLVGPGEPFVIEPTYLSPTPTRHAAAWDDWVYATTLLTFEPKAWGPGRDGSLPEAADEAAAEALFAAVALDEPGEAPPRAAVDALLGHRVSQRDRRWEVVISALTAARDDVALEEAYGRYAPMGRCSMDDRPNEIAQEHAAVCARLGRLGCFVQRTVQRMGDSFERVAWSSYGERAHDTGAAALVDAGVDAQRLLRGLMLDYESSIEPPVGIGLWRLARSAHELDGADHFEAALERYATDGELDDWNRFRATVALLWTAYGVDSTPDEREAARDWIGELALSPLAEAWLAEQDE